MYACVSDDICMLYPISFYYSAAAGMIRYFEFEFEKFYSEL